VTWPPQRCCCSRRLSLGRWKQARPEATPPMVLPDCYRTLESAQVSESDNVLQYGDGDIVPTPQQRLRCQKADHETGVFDYVSDREDLRR
jgi:hypothetical protein